MGQLSIRDLTLILKFKSSQIGYQDEAFKTSYIHTKVFIASAQDQKSSIFSLLITLFL